MNVIKCHQIIYLKWLKWQILGYIYFITKNNSENIFSIKSRLLFSKNKILPQGNHVLLLNSSAYQLVKLEQVIYLFWVLVLSDTIVGLKMICRGLNVQVFNRFLLIYMIYWRGGKMAET